jgi:hypothetical protein
MKQISRKAMLVKGLTLMVLFATTSSFSGTWGGDHYRVYLNNKLVLEQFVHLQKTVPSIQLDQRSQGDQISVYYSHCGRVGSARHLTFKDGQGKSLKTWNFADASLDVPMACKAKDIFSLQKDGAKLGMYYSSKELPDGKLLATVMLGKDIVAQP